jgi:hypothetical protein
MEPHPIRMVVEDDLERSRLTVFFRLLLAIPHVVWLLLWFSLALYVVAPIAWLLTLILGRAPKPLWNFYSSLVRYWTHVYAFVFLAGNPFPGFTGTAESYPIDLVIDPSERQSRWKTAFRFVLALPASWLSATLLFFFLPTSTYDEATDTYYVFLIPAGVALAAAFLAWFACMVRGRMPLGFRDLLAYVLRFAAQTLGYFFFVTDRYPDADTIHPRATQPTPERPVRLRVEDDLRRSRLTVFFRLLLFLPHYVWLYLWSIVAFLAAIVNWLVTLITGRSPEVLHRFLAAFVRYQAHVYSYLFLIANPFPGFTGTPDTYPVDVEIDPRQRQNRWITAFRSVLALPAFVLSTALTFVVGLVALYLWIVGLLLGRAPEGLRNLGAFVIRYWAQTYAYFYLLTDRYPFSGPLEYVEPEPEPEPEAVPAWPEVPPEPSF